MNFKLGLFATGTYFWVTLAAMLAIAALTRRRAHETLDLRSATTM